MGAQVQEDVLLKALANIESALAKGEGDKQIDGKPTMPDTTAEANGALGQEGDTSQLAQRSAAALAQYVNKAMADDDDDEEEEEDETSKSYDADDDDDDDEPRTRKSISQVMKSQMADGVEDAMPFLESLVDQVSESEQQLAKSLRGLRGEQRSFNETLAKAVAANCQMVLAIKKSLDTLMNQPAGMRKSLVSTAEVQQRFPNADGAAPQFSKADVLKAMCELIPQGKVSSLAVTTYENSNYMDPQVQKVVTAHLQKSA